jgi:hypothetical protein
LQPISKEEFNLLIESGVLTIYTDGSYKGTYGDNLVVTGKYGTGRGKQRYVTPQVYSILLEIQDKNKQNIDNIKDNQRYMFS